MGPRYELGVASEGELLVEFSPEIGQADTEVRNFRLEFVQTGLHAPRGEYIHEHQQARNGHCYEELRVIHSGSLFSVYTCVATDLFRGSANGA